MTRKSARDAKGTHLQYRWGDSDRGQEWDNDSGGGGVEIMSLVVEGVGKWQW